MKWILLTFLIGASYFSQAQQCPILFLQDLDPNPIEAYQFSEGWRLQNTSSSCNAVNYYLTPESAQVSYNGGSTWQSYSGMNFEFHRTSGPNQSNLQQSDRFSISAFSIKNINTWFNVSPNNTNVMYRVFFDIFDENNQVLPTLNGRLFTEFYYTGSLPDLEIQAASVSPQTTAAGDNVTIDFTVKNVGFSYANPTKVRIQYSSNTGYSSSSDPALGVDVIIGGLASNESLSFSITRMIPNNAQDGNRYIFIVADILNSEVEVSEGSANRERLSLQVASTSISNIYIDNIQLIPNPINWGETFNITFDQSYEGNEVGIPDVFATVYISNDCTISSDDQVIGTVSSSVRATDLFDSEEVNIEISSDFGEGIRYVIIVADSGNDINETDEEDNEYCIPFEIIGNTNYYTNSHVISTTTVEAGQSVSVNCNIQGIGNDRVYIGYYLSANCNFNPEIDVYLDDDNHNFSGSTSIGTESATLIIPANTPAGIYSLIIYTDYEFEIAETNENDNLYCFTIVITNTCTPPIANYFQASAEVEQGQGVWFNDTSTDATSWNWTFGGGTPATFDDRYPPTVVFDDFGDYTISLIVSNACGSDTKTTTIRVNPDQELPPTPHSEVCNPSLGGDPVNLSTGAYVYAVEDLRIRGINGSYSWRRFYNSSLGNNGSLGINWTHSYDIGLEINGSAWTVRHGNGQRTYYAGYNDGTALPLYKGTLNTLSKNLSTNEYTFTKQDGTIYIFNENGCIQTITNRVGNTIIFTHSNCQLTRITFPGGRYFDLIYTSGKITRVTDNTGRFVTYGYNGTNQNLVSSIDVRNGTTFFTYDGSHRILTQTDPRGNTIVSNIYNASGQVVSQSDALNYTTTFAYDTPISGATTMTNALNGTQEHHHNDKFRLKKFINELGEEILLGYDSPTGKIASHTNESNNTTFYDLDDNGNLVLIQDVLGNQTTITVNALNLPTTITNALGYTTTLGYNAVGNPTTLTLPNGAVYTSTFDGQGQVVTRSTPNGNTTTYQRNSFGDVTMIQTITGDYVLAVDGLGRVTSITDRNGNTTTFLFDSAGNVTSVTDALGYFILLTYDANNNLISYQDKEGNTTIFVYNERNELIQVTDPLNFSRFFVYDALGRLISSTDANGNIVTLTYDAKGQLIQTSNALGAYSMSYDPTGNIIDITDAEGNTYVIQYDDKNRPVRTLDPLGNYVDLVYNVLDQLISSTDENGNITQQTYDVMGWLQTITDALGGIVQYNRDLEGNLIGVIDANGNTTSHTVDAQGRKINSTYPGGYTKSATYDNEGFVITSTDENGIITSPSRDVNYNLTGLSFSNGAVYSFSNDKNGRLLTMANAVGTTTLIRDARGLITGTTDPFGNTIEFGYDGNGNRTSIAYTGGNMVTTTYNALDLPVLVSDWLGNFSQRSYNSNGNLTGKTNSNGTSTTITRDELGRVANYANFRPDMTVINSHTPTYDPTGNITAINEDVLLKPNYFPSMDEMLYGDDDRQTIRDGETVTTDNNGAITSFDSSPSSSFTWGQDDLLLSYIHKGVSVTNTYNPFGDRLQRTVDGETTKYLLDLSGGLTSILQEQEADGTVNNSYIHAPDGLDWKLDNQGNPQFYHFDYLGHTRALSDGTGIITDAYATDAFGDYLAHNGNTQQPFIFLGQFGIEHEGNGIFRVRRRFLDAPHGRFISKDMAPMDAGTQQSNPYVYGLNNPYRYMDIDGFDEHEALALGGSTIGYSTYEDLFSDNSPAPILESTAIYTYNPTDPLPSIEEIEASINNPNNYVLTNPTNSCSGYEELFLEEPQIYDPTFEILINLLFSKGFFPTSGVGVKSVQSTIYQKGIYGEVRVGVANISKKRIPSYTKKAKYRIPDYLNKEFNILLEVKNVKRQGFTSQLQDFYHYAKNKGLDFILVVRKDTSISAPLQKLIDAGEIILNFIPGS